jgi:hypothetical protein
MIEWIAEVMGWVTAYQDDILWWSIMVVVAWMLVNLDADGVFWLFVLCVAIWLKP